MGNFIKMNIVKQDLPLLRRYARALLGTQSRGNQQVRVTLEALIASPELIPEDNTHRRTLYALFHSIGFGLEGALGHALPTGSLERAVQARLGTVPALHRQLLLLTTLESFSTADAALITGITPAEAELALTKAYAEIEAQTRTSVLIIEDEPLIAMELENLVAKLGHEVAGNATTRGEALEMFNTTNPGLILADIQLADGSSGIDAVNDILAQNPVPVIFITAYPERLLTGTRPEPTYLITKPFNERTVEVALSQAAFLGTTESPLIAA